MINAARLPDTIDIQTANGVLKIPLAKRHFLSYCYRPGETLDATLERSRLFATATFQRYQKEDETHLLQVVLNWLKPDWPYQILGVSDEPHVPDYVFLAFFVLDAKNDPEIKNVIIRGQIERYSVDELD